MSDQFWTPPAIWENETAYIIAGGPSLRDVDLNPLRGHKVITINSSHARAIEAGLDDGVLFFTDGEWFTAHREIVAAWRGIVVTSSSGAKKGMPEKVNRFQGEWRPDFPKPGSAVIRKGRSSGQTAIGLAIALGVTRIILIAFDMQFVDGRSHHHDEYVCRDVFLYPTRFVPAFKDWDASARAVGVEILNATPDSALKEFRMIELEEVLA